MEIFLQPEADQVNALLDELESGTDDPLSPSRPASPFYDCVRHGWVLSRYADVLPALRDPLLSSRDAEGKHASGFREASRVRLKALGTFSVARLAEWRAQIERLAFNLVQHLPQDRPVEIVGEFARPWSLETALIVTGADRAEAKYLEVLARKVSEATADPSESRLQSSAKAANAELERYFRNAVIPMGGPAFVALSQTLPCFLANAWLALLRCPSELELLRTRPELMPRAVEELLRYAGLARKVLRQAAGSVNLERVRIGEGERLILMLASANRDPEQFPNPDRLDVARLAAGQVSFGAGPHSCVAASLIRMAAGVATQAILQKLAAAEGKAPIQWQGGSGFRWVARLHVLFRR